MWALSLGGFLGQAILAPGLVQAQEQGQRVAWQVEGEGADALIEAVAQALSTERSRHLLTPEDIEAQVRAGVRPWPSCALGVEPCGSATALAMDALGVELLVRVELAQVRPQLELNYEIVDWRGAQVSAGSLRERDARAAGFELVRELFDASGVISVESNPPGAQLWLAGEAVGRTPWSGKRAVGHYDFELVLEGYARAEGSVELGSGAAVRVDRTLAELPGRLRVLGAPQDAEIWIQDAPMGRADELLELPAGRYAMELRAPGFESLTRVVDVEPARLTETTVTMVNESSLLRDIDVAALVANRLQLVAALELGIHSSDPRQARGKAQGLEYSFEGWTDQGQLSDEARRRRTLVSGGLRLEALWEGERWGLGLLSLSYRGGGVEEAAALLTRPGGGSAPAVIEGRQVLVLRPMQLRYRYIWQNLVPHLETGLGVSWEHLRARETSTDEMITLTQTHAIWSLGAGLRYHFDARWSAGVSYRVEKLLGGDQRAAHVLGISIGMGLPDVPGLRPQPPEQL
ncbi:hypothetical protein DL240_10555 [Lujinxingia litoralis]|uniref:PEGA domain-containing protein n=1 Tax=Lujinxingia litoralis TaxID=2211119 RepID=A0A328C750_9DELT|nr:hypothetical protein DL240_10555 [Lujinxingia litoralis]